MVDEVINKPRLPYTGLTGYQNKILLIRDSLEYVWNQVFIIFRSEIIINVIVVGKWCI